MRSHILKIWVILLVCSGFLSTMVEPADAARSNHKLADWLQSLTKKTHASNIRQKLASLEKSKADINQIIEEASEIILRNDEDFNFPAGSASSDIQQILLIEWNQFRGNNTMTAVPLVESGKPLITPQANKFSPRFSTAVKPAGTAALHHCCNIRIGGGVAHSHPLFGPMISGISIGAP